MTWEYSEDNLVEQTAIDLFFNQLGWDTLLAYNKEGFGEGSTLGRLNKKEVVLKKIFFEKIKEFNPGLPQKAYEEAYEKLIEESITKSLAEINYEKHLLLRNGISVDFTNEKGEQVKNKTLKVFDFDNGKSYTNHRFEKFLRIFIRFPVPGQEVVNIGKLANDDSV